MILILLTYSAGVLTILSPCILPVLPFVFARSEQPFLKSGLPLLIGMSATFALFSALAIAGGEWVAHANQWGRFLSILLLSAFGVSLLFPAIAEKLTSPFVKIGGKLGQSKQSNPVASSFLIGISTGFLWAPCAGPILGLVLTGAASQNDPKKSVFLLLSYSLGAATSLAAALVAGGRFIGRLKKYLGVDRVVKRILGTAVLLGVACIVFDLDRTVLTHLSKIETASLETKLLVLGGQLPTEAEPKSGMMMMAAKGDAASAKVEGFLPEIEGVQAWINTQPLKKEDLLGKVVLLDFWTYSCINCLRTLPYLKAWSEKYRDDDFVVLGVHAPEFAFEKDVNNVKKAVHDLGIFYPVAIDNEYKVWGSFHNHYWPAHYLIDRQGRIRSHHFGEGEYEETEKMIQDLINENGGKAHPKQTTWVADGPQAQPSQLKVISPETYLGSARAEHQKPTPHELKLNEWSLVGNWSTAEEKVALKKQGGKIVYRFLARDLHLVLGSKNPIPFKITIDGHPPGEAHGGDTDEAGTGTIQGTRLYQLIRQNGSAAEQEHLFEITFEREGVEAYAFTFG